MQQRNQADQSFRATHAQLTKLRTRISESEKVRLPSLLTDLTVPNCERQFCSSFLAELSVLEHAALDLGLSIRPVSSHHIRESTASDH